MANRGYILLHRKLLDTDLWRQPPATVKTAVYLILSCNHKALPWATITIDRGETFRTIDRIATESSMSAPTIRNALRKLESIGFIKIYTPLGKNNGSLIKVINYNKYQSLLSPQSDSSLTHEKSKKHLNNSGPKLEQQAEEIYKIYPKKVGKPSAIKAIKKVINKDGFKHILEKTKLYAKEYNGDHRYIPHPSTFFNKERYNDDPSEWSQNAKITSNQYGPQQISHADFEIGIKEEL